MPDLHSAAMIAVIASSSPVYTAHKTISSAFAAVAM